MERDRYYSLQILRGLATMAVVAFYLRGARSSICRGQRCLTELPCTPMPARISFLYFPASS